MSSSGLVVWELSTRGVASLRAIVAVRPCFMDRPYLLRMRFV